LPPRSLISRRLACARSKASGEFKGSTLRYHLHTLVHAQMFDRVEDALARKMQIKGWSRARLRSR
jgi:predicted GIY-YIG superfamily endonuclease